MEGFKQRYLIQKFGFNQRHLSSLIKEGILKTLPLEKMRNGNMRKVPLVTKDSFDALIEGEHYLKCKECTSYVAQINSPHLKSCSGLSKREYLEKHLITQVMCAYTERNKAKTKEQRDAQSKKLKARFQTPEGEITREQIRQASIQMQAGEVGDRIKENLRRMNQDPQVLEKLRKASRENWQDESYVRKQKQWQEDNREFVLDSAKKARESITPNFTRPHRILKESLEKVNIQTVSEYPFSYYSIDEALPLLRIAIEVDGCYWHGCSECGFETTPRIRANDKNKNLHLEKAGWVILRIKEHDIYGNLENQVLKILQLIEKRKVRDG